MTSIKQKSFDDEELEEDSNFLKREVETELAMRKGFGIKLTVDLPNSKVTKHYPLFPGSVSVKQFYK